MVLLLKYPYCGMILVHQHIYSKCNNALEVWSQDFDLQFFLFVTLQQQWCGVCFLLTRWVRISFLRPGYLKGYPSVISVGLSIPVSVRPDQVLWRRIRDEYRQNNHL